MDVRLKLKTRKPPYVTLLVLAALLAAPVALSENSVTIAFVNAARVLESAPQATQARQRLEEEFAPRDQEIVELQTGLRELEDKLSREAASMEATERLGLERKLLTQKRELKRTQVEFEEDLNIRRNEEFTELQRLVAEVITSVAREQQFDLIVNEAAVIYASDRVDVTEIVLERLKNQN
jgi:outer membrane protein